MFIKNDMETCKLRTYFDNLFSNELPISPKMPKIEYKIKK